MLDKWYYTHDGKQHGPVSAEEIQSLAAGGRLLAEDLLWPEGSDRSTAVEAGAAVVTLAAAPRQAPKPEPAAEAPASQVTSELPDWLGDVRQCEQTPARPKPCEPALLPGWLSDIRQAEATPPPAPRPLETAVPEWLRDLRPPSEGQEVLAKIDEAVQHWLTDRSRAEESRPTAGPVALERPAPAAPPLPLKAGPLASPVRPGELPPRVEVAPDETPQVVEVVRDKAPPVAPVSPVSTPPVAGPAADAPAGKASIESPAPRAPAVAPCPQEAGFNPETGEILDADKFQKWQREQQLPRDQGGSAQPAPSIYEVFERGRRELKAWVDAEGNQALIMQGQLQEICRQAGIEQLFNTYRTYGPVLERKLRQHLDLLVDNRRRFYSSRT